MTVDVDKQKKERLIINWFDKHFTFDLQKIPGTGEDVYFILHYDTGLYLIDPLNHKSYSLRNDEVDED